MYRQLRRRKPCSASSIAKIDGFDYNEKTTVLADTDLKAVDFVNLIQNQVGDVRDFMKLKGINLNNRKEFNSKLNNGIAIREHFRQQMIYKATKIATHSKAVTGLGAHYHSLPAVKNAKDQQQEEDGKSKQLNLMLIDFPVEFKCSTINKKVDQHLLYKPIADLGCGLSPNFNKVFDQ